MSTEPRPGHLLGALTLVTGFFGGSCLGDSESRLTFEHDIRPVLKEYCFDCHGAAEKLKGELDLRLRRSIAQGGEHGPAIIPGTSDESLILHKLREGEMPPRGKKVPPELIDRIARWIDGGASTARAEPESLAPGQVNITAEERAFWSFQPVVRPEVAVIGVDDAWRVRTPIDALVTTAGHDSEESFRFAPDAGRRTLIRRAALDLTGLPPTREEVDAFLNDASDHAYENLIDRLLDSPHYGERWARHWLDVAGYADSEGVTNADAPREWAWKFRDYVIRSFNADKPFDRFILEQLAGDELVPRPHKELTPEQIELLTATGFLRMAGDGTGSGSDSEASRNQTMADTLKIVSDAFLGLTLECAQCHDHRYDPIPQRDYYQIRAIFEPALNPKQWRKPGERLISLYSEEDHKKAAEVEAEALAILEEKKKLQEKHIEVALRKELEAHFPSELREQLYAANMTVKEQRSPEQVELLKKNPSVNITGGNLYQYNKKAADELKEFDARAAKVREKKPFHGYLRALTEPANAKVETRLFHRGDPRQPRGEALPPAGLRITAQPGQRFKIRSEDPGRESTGRRLAFAKWLTSGEHPLVARVVVNRVWMHHFGRGLVGTAGDFGVLGERPTHPAVLDFLAHEFMRNGWSLKHLHRLIMRSTVYRQGSVSPHPLASVPKYSKWPVQRLDAETIRDRTLAVCGKLDRTMFGAPVAVGENDAGQFRVGAPRRSLYARTRRSQPVTLLQIFDAPLMETNCIRRDSSNAATQALMVMNGEFHVSSAKVFAERAHREAGSEAGVSAPKIDGLELPEHLHPGMGPALADQIAVAFDLAYGRPASEKEIRSSLTFLDHQVSHQLTSTPKPKAQDAQAVAMARLCHALLSSNEFLYVD